MRGAFTVVPDDVGQPIAGKMKSSDSNSSSHAEIVQ